MKIKNPCLTCGGDCRIKRKFCSGRCAQGQNKVCKVCGSGFQGRANRKYCSIHCRPY